MHCNILGKLLSQKNPLEIPKALDLILALVLWIGRLLPIRARVLSAGKTSHRLKQRTLIVLMTSNAIPAMNSGIMPLIAHIKRAKNFREAGHRRLVFRVRIIHLTNPV